VTDAPIKWGTTENQLAQIIRRFKWDADAPEVQRAVSDIYCVLMIHEDELIDAVDEAKRFEKLWLSTRWTWRGVLARIRWWFQRTFLPDPDVAMFNRAMKKAIDEHDRHS
jgi:hypothetical protein